MINTDKECKLLNEFKVVCEELNSYIKLNNLISKKIDLTLKILNSKSFKQSFYLWGINNPKELISIYAACKSEDGFIITYGSAILNGIYLDFCDSFIEIANTNHTKTYSITDSRTLDKISISLNELAHHYKALSPSEFNININITIGKSSVDIPLVTNEFVSSNGTVRHGFIKIDPIVKQPILTIIEDLFNIEAINSNLYMIDSDFIHKETTENVIPLFKPAIKSV